MSDVMYVSKESFEKMQKELHEMLTVQRPAASKAIAEAREKGDLRENAEYDSAREAQGLLEAKIAKLEALVRNARIVDESKIDTGKVSVLTKVSITNTATQKSMTYQLVGENEANLKEGKISITSPIGQGLLGKKVGEIAEIKAPNGNLLKFKINKIEI